MPSPQHPFHYTTSLQEGNGVTNYTGTSKYFLITTKKIDNAGLTTNFNPFRVNYLHNNIQNSIVLDINKNQTIFIGRLKENNELEEIFIQDRSDPSSIVEFFSKSGFLTLDKNITLKMKDGTKVSTDLKGKSTIINFRSYNIEIKRESSNSNAVQRVVEYNEYNFFELLIIKVLNQLCPT